MSKEAILDFLLNEYCPTPILGPWSYNKYTKTLVGLKEFIKSKRFSSYKETINQIEHVCNKFKVISGLDIIDKSAIDKEKLLFLKLCRNNLPDESIPWLDVCFVLATSKPIYAPILLTGGNDGNFDMSENFIKCIILLFDEKKSVNSHNWLESALFGNTTSPLEDKNTTGHNPDGVGGPNSGMGFEGKSLSNPWDYVLMMEGTILFAGNVSKRLSAHTGKAVFPFTSNASNVGYGTASSDDQGEGVEPVSKGELWLPVWKNPALYEEIKQVFNEGRVELGGKPAKTGTDFARAILTFGTERGISEFHRFCILKRKGKAYLFTHAGKIQTTHEPASNLIDELDTWYINILKIKTPTASLTHLIRNFDDAIMKFCTYRKREYLLQILIIAGKLERCILRYSDFKPLSELSDKWLSECYDYSAEFRLATSIASIYDKDGKNNRGGIRANLENIIHDKYWKHKKDSIYCVWKEDDNALKNMSRILHRRSLDGKIDSLDSIPIKGHIPARKDDISQFLNGELDVQKIGDLVLPFSILKINHNTDYPWKNERDDLFGSIPEAYIVLKMIYPPDKKENIPYDISITNLLHAERINDAYAKASYLLQTHGVPLSYSRKTSVTRNTTVTTNVKKHLKAALLFPISDQDRKFMLELIRVKSVNV